ncbi:MAG: hypothetical protein ABEH43_05210, partial [Flavobacteriales bacterium]
MPSKEFFVDRLTRDISFENAILDLIDNSIDALSTKEELDLSTDLIETLENNGPEDFEYTVSLSVEKEKFSIRDNCGGIG